MLGPAAVPSAPAVAFVVLVAVTDKLPPAEIFADPERWATATEVTDELAIAASTPVEPGALAGALAVTMAVEVAAIVTSAVPMI